MRDDHLANQGKIFEWLSMWERAMRTLSHQYDWSNVLVCAAHQQPNETAHLAVREGKNALFIYSAHANHIIAVAGRTEELVLLYCTAHGKPCWPTPTSVTFTSQFGSGTLPKYTRRTLSTIKALAASALRSRNADCHRRDRV